jgi:hypothetical protein
MKITVKYPIDYDIELYTSNSFEALKETDIIYEKRNAICIYDVPVTNKITLKALYKKKHFFKYSLFKNGWFSYAFSSAISFDSWFPKQTFAIDIKSGENSELNLLLSYDYVNSSMNGYVNKLKVEPIITKKVFIYTIDVGSIDNSSRISLKVSLAFGMIFNLLVYVVLIVLLWLSMLYNQFDTAKSNPLVDFLLIILLIILVIVNSVRYFLSYKDISEFISDKT